MRRFLPLAVILAGLSAGLGWLNAGTTSGTRPASADNWNSLQRTTLSKAEYKKMAQRFKQSSLLPLSATEVTEQAEIEAAAAAAQTVTGPKSAPAFPKIISVSLTNRNNQIWVQGPEDTVIKLQQGDTLESGWKIKTVDRRHVIAVFDDTEVEFPTIAYLKSAFEKPEDDLEPSVELGTDSPSGGE